MKHSWLILILGLIFSFLIPFVMALFPLSSSFDAAKDASDKISILKTYLEYFIGIILFALTIIFSYISHYIEQNNNMREHTSVAAIEVKKNLENILELVTDRRELIHSVDKVGLYSKLQFFCSAATQKIDLMYLNEVPPELLPPCMERDQFNSELVKIIREKKIPIRRIILLCEANRQWIKDLALQNKDIRSFSLSIVSNKPNPPISIQVIDKQKVVMISILKTQRSGKKHVVIESEQLASVFQDHFNLLVSDSVPIITNGNLDKKNFDLYLKKQFRS